MLKSIDKCLQILAKPASLPNLFRAYNGNGKYRKKSALEGTVAKDRVHDSYSNLANIHFFALTVPAQAFSSFQTDDNGQAGGLFKYKWKTPIPQIRLGKAICSNVFKSTWKTLFVHMCSNPHGENYLFKSTAG